MKGAGNMQTMQQYITEMGLEYSQKQFDACLTAFVSEMERGLAGDASSLKMIPAYLDAQSPPSDGGPVIAIDMGGTNLRIALIEWKNSRMHFLDRRQYPMPGTQGDLERSEFFEQIAEYLLPIADQSARIGLCFSFPCEILPTLEGKVLNFNKEVSIRNASGALLGQEIDIALQRSGCRIRHRTCVINDTVATLLGARAQAVRDYAGYIGFILGTGTNSCYREKNTRISKSEFLRKKKGYSLVNLESGGFAGLALNRVDQAFDAHTAAPGTQLFEKMISGAYQGALALAYLQDAARHGLLGQATAGRLPALSVLQPQQVDAFCLDPCGDNVLSQMLPDTQSRESAILLLNGLFDRASMLTVCNWAAVLKKMAADGKSNLPYCISAEGSTFYKCRPLHTRILSCAESQLNQRLGLAVEIIRAEESTLMGSALAALWG